jgi:putative transposase
MAFQHYRACLKRLSLPVDKYDLWRKTAVQLKLSAKAKLRLDWIIFYHAQAKENASLTCRHFGLKRALWYYWFNRFNETNLASLEDKSSSPLHTRQKEMTPTELARAIKLRKEHLHWSKLKLSEVYKTIYPGETLSSWYFQQVIQEFHLYPKPAKNARIQSKRQRALKKKRITELKIKLPRLGFLLHFDTIEIYWNGVKRYIITVIDHYTKLAFARMYATKSSASAEDFLMRTYLLLDEQVVNAHHDNGSEFNKLFRSLCAKLDIKQYHSRVHTPKDNPMAERFNQTLENEWLRDGNFTTDINKFNSRLAGFLVEYNSVRPHQSLDYLTPVKFAIKYRQLSERWASRTGT